MKRMPNTLAKFEAHELDLWKVTLSDSEEKEINNEMLKNKRGNQKPLHPKEVLSNLFTGIQDVDESYIVIELPDEDLRPSKRRRLRTSDSVNGQVEGSGFQVTPPRPPKVVNDSVQELLERYRPKMGKLVADAGRRPLIPLWTPPTETNTPAEMAFKEHIKTLAIPDVDGEPSLLLHDLFSKTSAIDEERIKEVFSGTRHKVLINTSGSGKTSLGLRGLSRNWGFYAVVEQGSDLIGSDDFGALMNNLHNSEDYGRAKLFGITNSDAANHMHQAAQRRVLQFLAARFHLLNLFVDEAEKCTTRELQSNHLLAWVLVQARPTQILLGDAFKEIAEALRYASIDHLQQQINDGYSKLEHILVDDHATEPSLNRPLYCFLDEIQETTQRRMGEFSSNDGKTERPLLRPIWLTLTKTLDVTKMQVILSGTGIDMKSLENVLVSTVHKVSSYIVKRDIGAFDDPNSQKQYIERYLPSQHSPSWEAFLERAWGWCRGRYRNTAILIFFILVAKQHSPHRILDLFIKESTGFTPTDGEKWSTTEPEIRGLDMTRLKGWNFDRLNSSQTITLCDILYEQMVYGCYTLNSFAPKADIASFIEYGFARIRLEDNVIDEPLPIMAAWNWLDKQHKFSLFNCLQRDIGKDAPRKNGFEAYLAFYVHKIFEGAPRLDEVFTFRSDFASRRTGDLSWQQEKFELVALSKSGNGESKISVVTPSSAPSSNVGLLAKTNTAVLSWVSENNGCYAFCFPTVDAGPDIFFYLRSKTTQKLLLVAVQARNYTSEVVEKSSLDQGVRTVTPSWFWKSKDKKSPDEIQASEIATSFCNSLLQIHDTITVQGASHPVLRVFASWPANAGIERTLQYKENQQTNGKRKIQVEVDEDDVDTHDPDPHPLAVLHMQNFTKVNEMLGESWYRGVEQREVVLQSHQYAELRKSSRIQKPKAQNHLALQGILPE